MRKPSVALAFVLLFLAAAPVGFAQTGPALLLKPNLSETEMLENRADALFLNQGSTSNGGADYQMQIYEVTGRFREERENFIPRIGWELTYIDQHSSDKTLPALDKGLTDVSVAAGVELGQFSDWTAGLTVGLGYAGDTPFGESDAWYGKATLIAGRKLDKDTDLAFVLDYDGNRTIWPDLPLPGLEYRKQYDPHLSYTIGVPVIAATWKPNDVFLVDITWTMIDQFDARAEVQACSQVDGLRGVGRPPRGVSRGGAPGQRSPALPATPRRTGHPVEAVGRHQPETGRRLRLGRRVQRRLGRLRAHRSHRRHQRRAVRASWARAPILMFCSLSHEGRGSASCGILASVPAHLGEYIVYILYVLLGPTAWVLFGVAMVRGRHRIWLLRRIAPLPEEHPRVSILIPAKDEGERIRACIESALAQQYDNFSVIAIDDRSTDRTGAIMDEMAAANPNLKVIHIAEGTLPPGWTGKCNALHSSVQHADGEWLLFVDSDVILQPNALPPRLLSGGAEARSAQPSPARRERRILGRSTRPPRGHGDQRALHDRPDQFRSSQTRLRQRAVSPHPPQHVRSDRRT